MGIDSTVQQAAQEMPNFLSEKDPRRAVNACLDYVKYPYPHGGYAVDLLMREGVDTTPKVTTPIEQVEGALTQLAEAFIKRDTSYHFTTGAYNKYLSHFGDYRKSLLTNPSNVVKTSLVLLGYTHRYLPRSTYVDLFTSMIESIILTKRNEQWARLYGHA